MKNTRFLLSLSFALSASAATTLESNEAPLDLRPSPRVAAATESLTYSVRWAGADALAGCTHKATLSVAGYTGSEILSDVPVLVRLSTAVQGFDYDDFADPATGADLVFCDESETTVFPHEIDEWNTNGESLVWVRLPALAAGTAFKMGYGGTAASAEDRAAAAHAVWSDYAGVWHLNEDSGTAFDSTAHGLDATPAVGTKGNASTLSEMVAYEDGACGRARVNDAIDRTTSDKVGTGNHLAVPSYDALALGDHFTIAGWFLVNSMTNYPRAFSRKSNYKDSNGWEVHFSNIPTKVNARGASESPAVSAWIPDVRIGWLNLLAEFNGSELLLYTNGAIAATSTITSATDNGKPLGFGSNSDGSEYSLFGQYDEMRLRGGSLSVDRIRADYDMVANHGFVTIGAVESAIAGPVVSAEILLDGEVFAGNLSGEGTVEWTPSAPGTYEFRHVSRLDGEAIAVETASFTVPGTEAEDLSILAEGDLAEGVAIRLGGATDGWTIHYTTDGSEPTAASPVYTGPFALGASATVKVVAVSDEHGWTSGVAEQRFDLAPPLAVTDATARQRYPWNGLVDVDFTLAGDAARRYRVLLEATDLDGGTNLTAKTVWADRGSVTNAAIDLAPGDHRLVWNAAADLPEGFVAERMSLDIRVEPIHDTALYMVVDLSGGPDAERYPVSYLPDVPEGGWSDEYKTDKLVLRRVEPGWFTMGTKETDYQDAPNSELHCVELTSPLYAAVFENTQKQWARVIGSVSSDWPGDVRPVAASFGDLRGETNGALWPSSAAVDETSFIGVVRAKTGLPSFDLPTEAQWEYTCRAGTESGFNNARNATGHDTDPIVAEVARYAGNSGWVFKQSVADNVAYGEWDGLGGFDRAANVGSYRSNPLGLYDMHGNVWEACLDWFGSLASESAVDPVGPNGGTKRVTRGGAWNSWAFICASGRRSEGAFRQEVEGFRLFLHDAPAVVEAPIVAPAGLTATTNRAGDVTLAWEPVAGAYAYQIRRSKTGEFEDGTWLNTVTNTAYADWTAEPRADYAYWVRAQFESGRVGRWSEATAGCRYKGYTVRFNANGGTGTMDDIECFFDHPRALPANVFAKSGNLFAGWATNATGTCVYADGETIENLTLVPGATVVLYALWTTTSYTVSFNANGGSGTMANQTIARDATATLRANAFTRSGYLFRGWATSASGTKVYNDKQSVKNITTGSTITLYAVWETATTYTIVFNANGAKGTMANQVVQVGASVKLNANKFQNSDQWWLFKGWSKTKKGWDGNPDYYDKATVKDLAPGGGTITLYACWTSYF